MTSVLVENLKPWRWTLAEGLIEGDACEELRSSILDAPMGQKEPNPDRPYDLEFIRVKLFDEESCPGFEWMTESVRQIVDTLASQNMRDRISTLLEVNLAQSRTEVNFWRWPQGSYVGPHLDRFPRIVTHVLYLNKAWSPSRGGRFEVLREKTDADPISVVSPQFGRSMLVVASEDSWHRISQIRGDGEPRLTVSTAYAVGTEEQIQSLGHARIR